MARSFLVGFFGAVLFGLGLRSDRWHMCRLEAVAVKV